MLTIKQVEPLDGFRLRVRLSNGKVIEPCLADYIGTAGYEGLQETFERVQVDEWGHAVEWPDDVGIGLEALYRLAKEQAGKAYPVAAFNQWMRGNGLSASEAAKALGLSRRTIIYYHTGAKPIPPVVGLACDGYNARLKQAA